MACRDIGVESPPVEDGTALLGSAANGRQGSIPADGRSKRLVAATMTVLALTTVAGTLLWMSRSAVAEHSDMPFTQTPAVEDDQTPAVANPFEAKYDMTCHTSGRGSCSCNCDRVLNAGSCNQDDGGCCWHCCCVNKGIMQPGRAYHEIQRSQYQVHADSRYHPPNNFYESVRQPNARVQMTADKSYRDGLYDAGQTPFDCYHNFETWETAWSTPKQSYCCREFGRGCPKSVMYKIFGFLGVCAAVGLLVWYCRMQRTKKEESIFKVDGSKGKNDQPRARSCNPSCAVPYPKVDVQWAQLGGKE